MEHSEGNDGESTVAILRFPCGSPRPCLLRTTLFWPKWQALSCILTACRILWGFINRVAFVTNMSNNTSLLCMVLLLLEEEWGRGSRLHPESRGQFRHSRNLWMVVICESLWESSVCRVGQVLPLQGVYRFESLRHSQLWVAACRCSHLVVCLVYCWWFWGVGYGYVQDYNIIIYNCLPLTLTWAHVLLVYTCSSL
jgi:hypothetical protein